ncbi:MAG TPA: hypothetical protein VGX23_20125 [Actinocrinis sp.]|nr:hypothetical protein [Actinocrinis sp.]
MSSRRIAGRKTSVLATFAAVATAAVMAASSADAAAAGSVWSVVKSPNVTTGTFATNALLSVSAVSDSNVWAAGFSNKSGADDSGDSPLIEHWNGTAWSVSPTVAQNAEFTGISADSATDAWAVGNVENATALLAEHWNGTAWSTAAMPVPSNAVNIRIEGVTAVSPTNAWAVGMYSDDSLGLPLIEHWNGTAWSITPNVPRQVSDFNDLHAVTAVSANDIWAVGEWDAGGQQQLLMHFDGTSWTLVTQEAMIGAGQSRAFPVAVSASASNDVWAVGDADFTGSDQVTSQQPFAEHWDGTQWTAFPTPAPAITNDSMSFTAVAAVSENDVWAVGQDDSQSILEHWDGTSWTMATLPALGASGNLLDAVAKSGPSSLWAVGDNEPKSTLISQSLTIHTTRG